MTSPLREAPEALLQALDDAIVGQRTSVLLASDDAQALDTCGRALLRRLRQHDGLETSVLYDMDRQLLVERFNRLLESMSIDEARRAEPGAARAQVWLLQIQAAEGIAQAQLLIRLAQEFPGAGVTLVLLAPDAVGRALAESIGRGLRVWRLEAAPAPSGPSLADALAEAPPDEPPAVLDVPPAGPGAGGSPRDAALRRPAAAGEAAARGRLTRWLLRGILVLFVVTALAVSWLLLSERTRPSAAAPAASSTASSTAPSQAAGDAAGSGPATAVGASAEASSGETSSGEATAGSPTAPAAAADPAPAAALPAPTAAPAAPTTPAPPGAAGTPGAILGEGARWAADLDPAAWVVQHLVLDSPTAVADWRDRHAGLASSQVVAIRRPRSEARAYALVSGPFASAADARAFLARPGVPPDHWMRRASGLQNDLDRRALTGAGAP